ncbi:2-succinylbenzoate-CoA ligase [Shewanella sp. NFH-SH190041]|uniref:o-succinylbenzoate--CoA ligase n=1 Tax=Shewanella sp. NFH-SH190041 TaxID=2950245 RepID=UPI0021C49486|nr:o-succinylbenzoate--CoA ligase [Shewanella sp. NFH-SH190041]BDM62896.1 2-succinylbenzoate-CoA ligase [Shewanella sp. NFH-SH190041]
MSLKSTNHTPSPLHQMAAQHPNLAALQDCHGSIDYANFSQQVLTLGTHLRQAGLQSGDILAIISENSAEMIRLYWACIDCGILFCPISPRFPESQIRTLMQRHQIQTYSLQPSIDMSLPGQALTPLDITTDATVVTAPQQAPQVNPNNLSNIIFTSGSSGTPKAALHRLRQHIASATGSTSLIQLQPGDHWLLSLPLFHIGGLAILNRCALAGACVVLSRGRDALAEQLQQDNITHVSLVATQLQRLLQDFPSCLASLKALLLGGGAISQPLLDKLGEQGIASFTSYGMTEMASQITTGPARADGSSGTLLPGRELCLRDGVIWVRGDTLFAGYLSDKGIEPMRDEQGWFCTKDCGFWDDAGRLHITGRSDNMFVCGGENLQPEEVEAVLKQLPGVEDALVFALPDPEFGHLPAAIIRGVIPKPDMAATYIGQHIARFKRPRRYFPWPEDISQTGLKINRKAVIAAVQRQFQL